MGVDPALLSCHAECRKTVLDLKHSVFIYWSIFLSTYFLLALSYIRSIAGDLLFEMRRMQEITSWLEFQPLIAVSVLSNLRLSLLITRVKSPQKKETN